MLNKIAVATAGIALLIGGASAVSAMERGPSDHNPQINVTKSAGHDFVAKTMVDIKTPQLTDRDFRK